jgi:phenylacetate-coenzyme A ligase PaaK-like adenylate-forming protein
MSFTPLQVLIPPRYDLLYHQMRSAYQGRSSVWRRITEAHRDAMVDYAVRHCPYYERSVPLGGAFEEIPLLTKALVREHHDDLIAREVPQSRMQAYRSAGSTGEPLRFFRDTAQMLVESAASDRFFRWLHGVPFEATIIAVMTSGEAQERFTRWGRLAGRIRSRLGGPPHRDPWLLAFPNLEVGPEDVQEYLDLWSRLDGYLFVGQSSGIDWIAQQIEERALPLRRPPVAIAATSDTLTEQARRRIERVFGVTVHTRYGSVEFPFLACSLPGTTDRYIFNPLLAHVEVLDDEGRPVRPGEIGRIVLTDLNNRVMPLIRYVQGDLAVASPEGFVGGFRLIEGMVGRESDLLRFPGGTVMSAASVSNLLFRRNDFGPWVRAFQIAQTGPTEVELRIVWAKEEPGVASRIAEALAAAFGPDTVVHIRTLRELERLPSGKVWVVRGLVDQPR